MSWCVNWMIGRVIVNLSEMGPGTGTSQKSDSEQRKTAEKDSKDGESVLRISVVSTKLELCVSKVECHLQRLRRIIIFKLLFY